MHTRIQSASCRTTETPPSERPQLFVRKLHQCHVLFDFNDASSDLKGKQIKAQTLHEMLEYPLSVSTSRSYPSLQGINIA